MRTNKHKNIIQPINLTAYVDQDDPIVITDSGLSSLMNHASEMAKKGYLFEKCWRDDDSITLYACYKKSIGETNDNQS